MCWATHAVQQVPGGKAVETKLPVRPAEVVGARFGCSSPPALRLFLGLAGPRRTSISGTFAEAT